MSKRVLEESDDASKDIEVKRRGFDAKDGKILMAGNLCNTGKLKTSQDDEHHQHTQGTCSDSECLDSAQASNLSISGVSSRSATAWAPAANPADDQEYFSSYSQLDIHRTMIDDRARTQAYRRAILTNYPLFYRKVVLDVGCGTGILSMFCCLAGARRVYAVEASGAAEFARRVAAENGFSDRVTVLQCRVEDAQLPESVDVIVSEWMGHALLYESMVDSVLLARDRWLRPGGAMFPERAVLKMALCTAPDHALDDDDAEFWRVVHARYGVHMASLAEEVEKTRRTSVPARVTALLPEEVHSHAATLFDLDLRTVPARDVRALSTNSRLTLVSFGRAELTALVLWFDAHFPGGETLSTSPYDSETHWGQTVLPVEALTVDQDTIVHCAFSMAQNERHPRNWTFQARLGVGDNDAESFTWVMDGTS